MYHLVPSLLLLLWQTAGASAGGIIGYGITMYKPVCAYACSDALSSLYLNCTTFMSHDSMDMAGMKLKKRMDMGSEMMGMTSDECYATDRVWQETLAYCMKDRCGTIDGVSEERIAKAYSKLSNSDAVYSEVLPAERPATELDADAEWLNVTSLVNSKLYFDNRQTRSEFEYQETMHARLSIVVYVLTVGIALVVGYFARFGLARLVPVAVSKHLVLPALFNGRHQAPLPGNLGYAPSRLLSFLIFLYVLLNIIFSAVPYKSVAPNAESTWFTAKKNEIATYVANRTGVLSFANLGIAILFAGRLNPLILLSGLSQNACLTFHRWAARVSTAQAIVHSIIYTVTYFWDGGKQAYYDEVKKAYYWWGIVATVLMSLGLAFSILPLRKAQYEIFLVAHVIMAIMVLIGCWYHIELRFGTSWGYEVWLYICIAFWSFDRLARFGLARYRNMWGTTTQAVAELTPGGHFIKLTVYPGKKWTFGPGQHAFLFFPSTGRFWENHPFSIAAWDHGSSSSSSSSPSSQVTEEAASSPQQRDPEKDADMEISHAPAGNDSSSTSSSSLPTKTRPATHATATTTYTGDGRPSITFLIRPHKGMTSTIQRELAALPTPTHFPLSLEGPHGHAADLSRADAILCIAGGIGITALTAYTQHFVEARRRQAMAARRLVLAWSYRERELAPVVRALLPADAEALGVVFVWRCTTEGERVDVPALVQSEAQAAKRLAVLVSASGGLADEVRRWVVECEGVAGTRIQLHEESFTW
ncbi:uncharacterized protein L3040_002212 [Drepanopeziza brunnea f. sp. 'multigermtubi']|uniref:Ferric reductase like transmembrane component n=1 Tax=Marssonina brunnea f. sp. multigermtubi (strain MB_m1) TaxID=1072389 RepID=K1XH75_MARBU|nr:ferric reductase like transmembrane component [Drepanopeziza brunnea f. sp. 'multigermtubi' MB_m1]EKD20113.1 ferric reductase like transmembrane component [Drepanopeziza brunnea f. sp. 'multigermtubi' MB_m1]KAJ5050329.1 hypothetical protein L3040_002212 [Drepanopeziza brunnea f. sp. 'multigermtubi']